MHSGHKYKWLFYIKLHRINFPAQKMITTDLFNFASDDFNIKSEATQSKTNSENYPHNQAVSNKLNVRLWCFLSAFFLVAIIIPDYFAFMFMAFIVVLYSEVGVKNKSKVI